MPHNFRLTGFISPVYISKVGNDANAGTDPNLPKATVGRYATNQVIGTGVYKGAFTLTAGSTTTQNPDGYVVLNLTGTLVCTIGSGSIVNSIGNSSNTMEILGNGFSITTQIGTLNYTNIIFRSLTFTQPSSNASLTINFTRCVFDNINTTITAAITNTFSYCQIYNSTYTLQPSNTFNNNYVDQATIITMPSYFTTPSTQFRNNNFRGIFVVNGVSYELKRDKLGNPINPNPNVLDLDDLEGGTGTVYARGNFSEDIDHLNIEKRGYNAVASTSPALYADTTTISNIGNVWYGVSYDVANDLGAIDTDLVISTNDLIVQTPATFGTRITSPIQLAPIAQPIGRLNFRALRNFNSSETIGTAENSNVTIVDNYNFASIDPVIQAGANPRRLTYEMRWSNQTNAPALSSEWDNQGYVTAGNWVKFEQNTMPMIDPAGRGNGEPLYTSTGATGLKAKWIQFRITVRNGIG